MDPLSLFYHIGCHTWVTLKGGCLAVNFMDGIPLGKAGQLKTEVFSWNLPPGVNWVEYAFLNTQWWWGATEGLPTAIAGTEALRGEGARLPRPNRGYKSEVVRFGGAGCGQTDLYLNLQISIFGYVIFTSLALKKESNNSAYLVELLGVLNELVLVKHWASNNT